MKRRKLSLRLISLLLCFVMLGLSSPIVIAEEAEIQTQETQPPSSKDGATSTNELQEPEQTEAATESLVASANSSTQISDGLYKIKDVASGLYLEVIGGATASGTGLQLWSARTGADEARQLFAIEYVGTEGNFVYYTLRPQVNPSLRLTIIPGISVTVSTLSDDPLGDQAYDQLIVLNGTMNSCQIQGGYETLKSSICTPTNVTSGTTVFAGEGFEGTLIRNFCLIPQTTITSGVYRIKNVANNWYLNLPYTVNQTLGALDVTSFTDSEAFMRNQLFKVSLVENIDGTNYYTIRSMVDNSVGLWLEYLMVNTTTLATTDDSLGEYGISIVATEGGYLIQGGMPDCKANLAAPATFANGNAVFASGDAAATTSKWVFEEYTTPIHGITWKAFDSVLGINQNFLYSATMYSSAIGCNGPIVFSVKNLDGTTTDKASINSNGRITTHKAGTVQFLAQFSIGGSSYVEKKALKIKFEATEYYLKHASDNEYLYMYNGTLLQAGFAFNENWRWQFVYDETSGYYQIHQGELYLTAPTSASHGLSMRLTTLSPSLADYQRFNIIETTGDAYKIQAKAREGTTLYVGINHSVSIGYVQQVDYSNIVDHTTIGWVFYQIHGGADAFLLGVNDYSKETENSEGHDHRSALISIQENLISLNYSDMNECIVDDITRAEAMRGIVQSRIFVFRGHGGKGANYTFIVLNNDTGLSISSDDFYDFTLDVPQKDLSRCDIMLLAACHTADHPSQSLAHAAVRAGAKNAIGFGDEIWCCDANTFVTSFFENYEETNSVSTASYFAVRACANTKMPSLLRVVS